MSDSMRPSARDDDGFIDLRRTLPEILAVRVSEATEPAIPVIAPVPLASLRSLLDVAAQDWPTLDAPGARVAWAIDARGVSVAATLSIHDWDGRVLARRDFNGQWEVGGSVTWTPGR